MEKVKKRYLKQYPMLRLFKDDLKKIVSLFEKDHQDAEIIIDEFKIVNSDDLDQLRKSQVSNFSIEAFQRYPAGTPSRTELLRLELKPYEAEVRVSNENDTHLRGIASQIDTVLSQRRSKLHFLTSIPLAIIVAVILLLPIYIINDLPWSFSKQPTLAILLTLLMIILIAFAILWLVWCWSIRTKKYVVIYPIDSTDKSNFFSRNRDEIPKMILSAIIGGIVTLILGGMAVIINWLVHLLH